MDATEEAGRRNQNGAGGAVDQMKQGVAQVEQGSFLADRIGQVIGEIDAGTQRSPQSAAT